MIFVIVLCVLGLAYLALGILAVIHGKPTKFVVQMGGSSGIFFACALLLFFAMKI